MTCCAEDISFVGFLCKYDQAQTLSNELDSHYRGDEM